jgi:hypothetical protein
MIPHGVSNYQTINNDGAGTQRIFDRNALGMQNWT